MKIFVLLISLTVLVLCVNSSFAKDEHASEKNQHEVNGHKDENHDHKKEIPKEGGKHAHDDKEEGEAKNVGPDKGITSFDEERGFTLSEEAKKNFSIEVETLNGLNPWQVPASALLLTGEEKNIYRLRDGVFKRIDIEIITKEKNQVMVQSEELRNGDAVVIKGVGFLRIAEVDVTNEETGHRH